MAKKSNPTEQSQPKGPFDVNVGEWGEGDGFRTLGVPSGYLVLIGNTSAFVPAVETAETEP